jgi:glycosyltransferase involved in cell wall biosynthesis
MLHGTGRYRISVAVQNGEGPLRGEIECLADVELTEYPLTSFYDRNALLQWRKFRSHVRDARVDVVHTHDFYSNIFGLIGAWVGGVKVRVASRRETTGTRTPMQKRVETVAFGIANAVVANAQEVREQLMREGVPEQKISVIYNGIDLPSVQRETRDRVERLLALGLPTGQGLRFVTLVANMRLRVKDHPMFLRAAAEVAMRRAEARFVLAGEGPLAEEIRLLSVELGLADKVVILGECSRIPDLLAVSDVCVLTSKAEGFSNAILEYMAAARPVVVTDVGGAREAVEDGRSGYLVKSGDVTGMAGHIMRLLDNAQLAQAMGRAGRQVVETRFSSTARLQATERLYARLAGSRAVR